MVSKIFTLLFLTLQISQFSGVSSSNILFFHTSATASHRTSIWPLVEKLADSGHNITYIFSISRRPGSHPKVEELKPSKMFAAVENFVGEFDINFRLNGTLNEWLTRAFEVIPEFCEAFYDSPETLEWLSRPGIHYDLVMIDGSLGQCAYGLVHKFQAKHVLFNPVMMPFLWDPFGVVPETSSVPEFVFHQKPGALQTSLWSRVLTTIAPFLLRHATLGAFRKMEAMARDKLNLTEMPSFEEIEQETSLVFHNSHFIEDYPMSLPPLFVSYSGLLCSEKENLKRKPLPQKLAAFLEDDSEGFVYVSFGSSIVVSAMPEQLQAQFLNAFANFPKLKFLWRWTGPVPKNPPKNVLFQSWFPQLDLLAHPKVKAFVMQAGRPSAQEALCYGVPMITIPIFGDQDMNADRLEQIGVAISLEITTLTSSELTAAIAEITEDKKYKEQMTRYSEMYKDRPVDPVEHAFYWVEYVLRHDTTLLKPLAMKQTWWQRRLLDVYAFLLIVILFIITVVVIFVVLLCKLLLRVFGFKKSVGNKTKTD